jgi:uncharacterized protein (DUF486 family)
MSSKQWYPIFLLAFANLFMTYAWYGHLKNLRERPLIIAILSSWLIAFLEYCLQVPANRMGAEAFTLAQLKIIQEILTMLVFAGFAVFYMKVPITRNYLYASICLLGAAYFIFRD